jgi:hypothetical protein
VVEQLIADRLTLSHCPRRELPETAVSGTRRLAGKPGGRVGKVESPAWLFCMFDANLVHSRPFMF